MDRLFLVQEILKDGVGFVCNTDVVLGIHHSSENPLTIPSVIKDIKEGRMEESIGFDDSEESGD